MNFEKEVCCGKNGPDVKNKEQKMKRCRGASRNTEILFIFVNSNNSILAWEPPALPRLLIFSPAVYPQVVVNYDFSYFSPIKIDPLNLDSQNQAKEHSCGSPLSLFKV